MIKAVLLYKDGSSLNLKFSKKHQNLNYVVDYLKYNYFPNVSKLKSCTIQQYPLKDNKPIDYFSLIKD